MSFIHDLWFPYLSLVRPDRKTIISNETFFGRAWNRAPSENLTWAEERELVLRALGRLFSWARPLVCFRNHPEFILSLYKQYLHEGGHLKIEEFFKLDEEEGIVAKEDIVYMDVIRILEESFEKKPYVFLFDDVKHNIAGLLWGFEGLFGEPAPKVEKIEHPANEGVKFWQAKLLRRLNSIDKKPGTNLKPTGNIQLTNRITKKLRIDPRSICQNRLSWISNRPLLLDTDIHQGILQYFASDWASTKEYAMNAKYHD